jgi:uncharacterized repeat protein (TIGR01451 family)
MASSGSLIRRILILALSGIVLFAVAPAVAGAATPASLRLLGADPSYGQVTLTAPDGTTAKGSPGRFRLRVTPTGGTAVEYRGFCVDLRHSIGTGTDYAVSLRTATDDPALAGPRHAEAAWLLQSAEGLIAAAPSATKGLEAGAIQVAVWQLVGEAREGAPTSDAALNARAAAIRVLAAGRAVGGPLTATPTMPKGCAGRSAVGLHLTGTPGSTAKLAVSGGPGAVSPSEVRFGADGTAEASVTSPVAGTVTVTARAEGGALTRIARAGATQTTPQETVVLVPRTYEAVTSVVFENCPLIPSQEGGSPTPSTPVTPFEAPSSEPAPPAGTTPPERSTRRTPNQTGPRLSLSKSGPSRALAGARVGYVIRVTNRGGAELRGLTVADDLPAGMSLASVPSGGRLRSGRVVWTIGSLAPGATRTLRVSVRIDSDIAGRRCNRATATVGQLRRTASSCTRIRALRRPIVPAVTA